MTRRISLAAGLGCVLLACGGISREERDGVAPSSSDGTGGGSGATSADPSAGGSSESGSAGTASAGTTSAGGGGGAGPASAGGSGGATPNGNSENHDLAVSGNVDGLMYDFSCTADTGKDRVRSVEGDLLRCNSQDTYDVTVVISFPPIGEGFEPGPFDFQFVPSEPSPAKLEIYIGSGVVNSTRGANFEGGRLSGTLERRGDPPNVVDVYTGTFDASWARCGKGCDGGSTKGTFSSEFAF